MDVSSTSREKVLVVSHWSKRNLRKKMTAFIKILTELTDVLNESLSDIGEKADSDYIAYFSQHKALIFVKIGYYLCQIIKSANTSLF